MPFLEELLDTEASRTAASFPPLSVRAIQNCAFSSWYPKFSSVSLKSIVISPLPEDFIDYLNADGVFLPLDRNGQPQPSYERPVDSDYDDESDDKAEGIGEGDEEPDDGNENIPHFPDLEQQIMDAIEQLGGAVFPKMNWSSPRDAAWITMTNTLKCDSVSDVFLLLKSSDFISHDLSHAFENCVPDVDTGERDGKEEPVEKDAGGTVDVASPKEMNQALPSRPEHFELVLRKWYDMLPSMEFRCFVTDGQLLAISQRDHANYYDFLPALAEDIRSRITNFYNEKIRGKFPDESFVFDVYINKSNRKVWLVDFNPFAPTTDSLLFTWEELLSATSDGNPTATVRIVQSQQAASSSLSPAFGTNRLPRDAIDLSNGVSIAEFAERFRREVEAAVE
ncbi:hypothetical protein HK104_010770 [Borealophlyctis nickersoniae]|nr:hypothetical protein HK104_010770 [Borealophlyctis nickersoniae]